MADIDLVIKIPQKVYRAICDKNALGCDIDDIKNIIRNGTPLPKGHGDLKDAEVITRGNCMICGKELTEGLFLCKKCEDKQAGESEET